MQVDDTLRIVKWDKFNLAIEIYVSRISKEGVLYMMWKPQGFYSSMKTALGGALHHKIFDSETTQTLKDLIERINNLESRFKDLKVLD